MAIRIQPKEPDICEDNPFKNDLLNRKQSIEVLTSIIGSIEGPCVLAVDAAWGTGKTTFLRMWSQHLRNRGFSVVEFNAWETDFSGDPFIALSSEITDGLGKYAKDSQSTGLEAFRKATRQMMRTMSGPLLRIGASAVPSIGHQIVKELESPATSTEKDATSEYLTAKGVMHDFKVVLHDTAAALAESRKGKPLVVMIDELDRCRPSYAVALLEVAKHLFIVDRMVFVLAVDRAQLAHSVKVLYGDAFDAEGYLRRFFDVDYRLPYPKRDDFIKAILETTGILSYFDRTQDEAAHRQDKKEFVQKLLLDFFGRADLSLRTVGHAIHRLGLVFASRSESSSVFGLSAAVAVILRTLDTDLYHQFVRNEISDLDVADRVLDQHKKNAFSQDPWRMVIFEAFLILAARENRTDDRGRFISGEPYQSPLLEKYQRLVDQAQTGDNANPLGRQHASSVLEQVHEINRIANGHGGIGFRDAVNRLELLSANLSQE